MKVYISGKISGIPMNRVVAKFNMAEALLAKYNFTEIVNPIKLDHSANIAMDWVQYMRVDLIELLKCNTIAVLPCYKDSPGAKIEVQLAISLGFDIIWLEPQADWKKLM